MSVDSIPRPAPFYRQGWFWLCLLATLISLIIRNSFRGFVSYDFMYFYLPWSEHLEANGGFAGIPSLDTDYTVAYHYILAFLTYLPASYLAKVKVVSTFFDLSAAILIFFIVAKLDPAKTLIKPGLAYIIALFIPTVILNSAVWGQCDSIYTAFVLGCILALLHRKFALAFFSYGIALAFKLQAIFFLPVLCLLLLEEKQLKLWHFLIIPAVNFAIYLPAWALGKPLQQFFDAYLIQVTQYSDLVRRFPSLWHWLNQPPPWMQNLALVIALGTIALFYLFNLYRKNKLTAPAFLIQTSMLTVMLCALLLPTMHERYMYMADLLAAIYLVFQPRKFFIPLAIWAASLVGYLDVLFGITQVSLYRWFALILLAACMYLMVSLFKKEELNSANQKLKADQISSPA